LRSTHDTMPAVTLWRSRKGLPSATTHSPTRSLQQRQHQGVRLLEGRRAGGGTWRPLRHTAQHGPITMHIQKHHSATTHSPTRSLQQGYSSGSISRSDCLEVSVRVVSRDAAPPDWSSCRHTHPRHHPLTHTQPAAAADA
jgi:hypothetical protein